MPRRSSSGTRRKRRHSCNATRWSRRPYKRPKSRSRLESTRRRTASQMLSRELMRAAKADEPCDSAVDASLVTLPASRLAVDARGLALGVLAALASVYALWWARAFAIPLLLGIVISYTLYPLVAWLEALKITRVLGTAIVMGSVMSALVFGAYSLRGQMQTIIGQLPEAATKLSEGLAGMQIGQNGSMQKMQSAAA